MGKTNRLCMHAIFDVAVAAGVSICIKRRKWITSKTFIADTAASKEHSDRDGMAISGDGRFALSSGYILQAHNMYLYLGIK